MAHASASGQRVAAWEFGNEPNAYAILFGPSNIVTPAQYAADLRTARALIDEASPGSMLVGPASAYWPILGEPLKFMPLFMPAGGALLDAITWHYYPQQSRRCPALTPATPDRLTDLAALAEVDTWAASVESSRDAYAPAADVWLGETGNAQCGGEPGVSDRSGATPWWLDQLGRIARRGEPITVRQTLSGADYGLLDDSTLTPRPDYWASVLFKRLMGVRALAAQTSGTVQAYAHCSAASVAPPGAVTALLVNRSGTSLATASIDALDISGGLQWMLDADRPDSATLRLNGQPLLLNSDGSLPPLPGAPADLARAALAIPPRGAAFVVLPAAHARACELP
jgi:heparanase 1